MECNLRARAREVHGHGDQLLTLLKVRAGSRVARAAWADPLPVCTRLSPEGQMSAANLSSTPQPTPGPARPCPPQRDPTADRPKTRMRVPRRT